MLKFVKAFVLLLQTVFLLILSLYFQPLTLTGTLELRSGPFNPDHKPLLEVLDQVV